MFFAFILKHQFNKSFNNQYQIAFKIFKLNLFDIFNILKNSN